MDIKSKYNDIKIITSTIQKSYSSTTHSTLLNLFNNKTFYNERYFIVFDDFFKEK